MPFSCACVPQTRAVCLARLSGSLRQLGGSDALAAQVVHHVGPLERVVREATAVTLIHVNQLGHAVVLHGGTGRQHTVGVMSAQQLGGDGAHSAVGVLAVNQLLLDEVLQCGAGGIVACGSQTALQSGQHDVARVDHVLEALLRVHRCGVVHALRAVVCAVTAAHELLERLEEGQRLRGHALLSVLAHVRGRRLVLHRGELLLQCLLAEVGHIAVLHPADRVQVAQVRLARVVPVAGIAALIGVGCGGGEDVDVVGQQAVKHRAGFACLQVEDQLMEALVGGHLLQCAHQILGVQVGASGHGNQTGTAVVGEEDEDVVIGARVDDAASVVGAVQHLLLAGNNGQEVLCGHGIASVVLGHASVHIRAVRLVDDVALVGVLAAVGDVVVHHHNNVRVRNTMCMQHLICVAHISLMAVVEVAVGTSNHHGPVGTGGGRGGDMSQSTGHERENRAQECRLVLITKLFSGFKEETHVIFRSSHQNTMT